jgi:pimeloyl-ACP methyl ester carboxylesterase
MPNILAEIKFDTIDIETLFIDGEKSDYIHPSDFPEIEVKFPNSILHTIENSGHWVHAEAPDEFFNVVSTFLR